MKKITKKRIKMMLHAPRLLMYRLRGGEVDFSTEVCARTSIYNSKVGKYGFISIDCWMKGAEIGNYVSMAGMVQIGAMEHPYWDLSTNTYLCKELPVTKKTKIGNDVWIASQVVIRQGVTIGDGAVIGANSFVNKDVPPYSVVVGSPARVLKYRFSDTIIEELQKSRYWEFPPKKARKILVEIRNRYSM